MKITPAGKSLSGDFCPRRSPGGQPDDCRDRSVWATSMPCFGERRLCRPSMARSPMRGRDPFTNPTRAGLARVTTAGGNGRPHGQRGREKRRSDELAEAVDPSVPRRLEAVQPSPMLALPEWFRRKAEWGLPAGVEIGKKPGNPAGIPFGFRRQEKRAVKQPGKGCARSRPRAAPGRDSVEPTSGARGGVRRRSRHGPRGRRRSRRAPHGAGPRSR